MTNVGGLFLFGGGVALALGVSAPAAALTIGALHHETVRATLSGTVTRVVASDDVGDITVVPGSVTRVVAVEQYNFTAPTVTDTLREGVLRIVASCPSTAGPVDVGLNDCASDLVITVPRAVAVDAVSDVGDVRTQGLRGPERLRSSAGDVIAEAVAARTLKATTDSGDVRLVGVRSRVLTLRSSAGDIDADLAAAPDRIVASTTEGDVKVTLPSGTYAVELHTDYGTSHVQGITEQSDAPHMVSARTSDGDIRIVGRQP